MFAYIWPVALVVFSNTVYQIAAKQMPEKIDPLASLTVTYLVGAAASLVFYFIINRNADLMREYGELNWAPFALGIAVVGLEVGMIYAYKAGWAVSMLSVTHSTILAIVLIFVGALAFGETITWNKILGEFVCMGGLALINFK